MAPTGRGSGTGLVRHRRTRGRPWWLAVVASLAACQHPAPPPDQAAPAPAPVPREAYVSDLAGVAFGHAFARATADGAPATDTRSSDGDQAVDATASANGAELERSCRNQGTQSHAQATAAFRPSSVVGVRQFGFTLSTATYAKGGSWREQLVLCRGSHNTVATADARANGRVDLTFNASDSASEQLILRVSGATPREAHLEVRDGVPRPVDHQGEPGCAGPEGHHPGVRCGRERAAKRRVRLVLVEREFERFGFRERIDVVLDLVAVGETDARAGDDGGDVR